MAFGSRRLTKKTLSSKSLSYPNDLGKYRVKLVFKEYQYNITSDTLNNASDNLDQTTIGRVNTATSAEANGFLGKTSNNKNTNATRINTKSIINLPLPDGLQDNDTFGVSETELGGLGFAAAVVSNIFSGGIRAGAGPSGDKLKSDANAVLGGLGAAAARTIMTAGGLSPELQQGYQVGAGVNFNPYTALNFTGVQLKGHTLSWSNLTPKSRTEAEALHRIIRHIKRRSHPEYLASRAFLSFPDIVEITIQGPNPEQIVKFKPALVSTIDVNYGAGGELAWLQGGTPAAITFSMSVKETQIWTKDDFSEDD